MMEEGQIQFHDFVCNIMFILYIGFQKFSYFYICDRYPIWF